jgi:hypothetical protein
MGLDNVTAGHFPTCAAPVVDDNTSNANPFQGISGMLGQHMKHRNLVGIGMICHHLRTNVDMGGLFDVHVGRFVSV